MINKTISFQYMYEISKTFYIKQILIGISTERSYFPAARIKFNLTVSALDRTTSGTKVSFLIYIARIVAEWTKCKFSLITIRGNEGGFITQYLQEANEATIQNLDVCFVISPSKAGIFSSSIFLTLSRNDFK